MNRFTFVSYRLLVILLVFLVIPVINHEALWGSTVLADEPDGSKAGLPLEPSSEADLAAALTNRRVIFIYGYPAAANVASGEDAVEDPRVRNFWLERENSLGAFLRDNLPLSEDKFLFHSYNGEYDTPGFTHPDFLSRDVCQRTGDFVPRQLTPPLASVLRKIGSAFDPDFQLPPVQYFQCVTKKGEDFFDEGTLSNQVLFLDDIINFCEGCNEDTKFDIIGHSFGGYVALFWAGAFLDVPRLQRKINSIITIESPVDGWVPTDPARNFLFFPEDATNVVRQAPSRVPVYNVSNVLDLAVPFTISTLPDSWQIFQKAIPVNIGGFFHDPTTNRELQERVLLALNAGKIQSPSGTDQLRVSQLLRPIQSHAVLVAKPTFHEPIAPPIAGGTATKPWTAEIDLVPATVRSIYGIKKRNNFQGNALITIGAPNLPTGTKHLRVNTNGQAFPTDTALNSVEYVPIALATESSIANTQNADAPIVTVLTEYASYTTFDPIKVAAVLADSQPLAGSLVEASLVPTFGGVSTTITLFDDGAHGDGEPNDGIYANTFPGVPTPGDYMIDINAAGTLSSGEPFSSQAQLPITIDPIPVQPADLFIILEGPATATPGSTVEYSLTFGNNGPESGLDSFISGMFAKEVTYVADTIGGITAETYTGGRIWDLATVTSGDQQTATLSVTIPPSVPVGTVVKTALLIRSASTPDLMFDNNITEVATEVQAPPPRVVRPVGGYGEPLSALELLAPWIVLLAMVAIGPVVVVVLKRRTV